MRTETREQLERVINAKSVAEVWDDRQRKYEVLDFWQCAMILWIVDTHPQAEVQCQSLIELFAAAVTHYKRPGPASCPR